MAKLTHMGADIEDLSIMEQVYCYRKLPAKD